MAILNSRSPALFEKQRDLFEEKGGVIVIPDAIRKQTNTASMTISSARAQENLGSPWVALTSAEKISAINRLIQREIARVVPPLLKAD